METPTACLVCGATRLRVERRQRFSRPVVELPRDRGLLVRDIGLERRWLLFAELLPDSDVLDVAVMACPECGFRFLSPRLSQAELAHKYAVLERHGFVRERYAEPPTDALTARARRIAALVDAVAPLPAGRPMVADVGGAWGYNLVPYADRADCVIIDYERWPADHYPSGVRWVARTVEETNDSAFSRVLFAHTLEHVSDPHAAIAGLAERLGDGGALYVEVPLGVWHETAHLDDPITHLNFFGEQSLARLLHRCGLRVAHISTRHQRITLDAQWCVNAVGVKGPGPTVRALPAWIQRHHPWYYARAAAYKLATAAPAWRRRLA